MTGQREAVRDLPGMGVASPWMTPGSLPGHRDESARIEDGLDSAAGTLCRSAMKQGGGMGLGAETVPCRDAPLRHVRAGLTAAIGTRRGRRPYQRHQLKSPPSPTNLTTSDS